MNSNYTTNEELVKHLIDTGVLQSEEIIEAFRNIDRAHFTPPGYESEAYADYPLPIGFSQTISQPTTVAFMLELLRPKQGNKVLDVGSGSGWTAALLGHIVGKEGSVYGTEIVPELVRFAKKNISKYKMPWVRIREAGETLGLKDEAPFNRILVSASGQSLPQELIDQLDMGGIMVIPVGNSIFKITKRAENKIDKEEFEGFIFVPLR